MIVTAGTVSTKEKLFYLIGNNGHMPAKSHWDNSHFSDILGITFILRKIKDKYYEMNIVKGNSSQAYCRNDMDWSSTFKQKLCSSNIKLFLTQSNRSILNQPKKNLGVQYGVIPVGASQGDDSKEAWDWRDCSRNRWTSARVEMPESQGRDCHGEGVRSRV